MHKPESVLENKVCITLLNLKIQMDCLIPVRKPDLVLFNKKKRTYHLMVFAILVDYRLKIKNSRKKDKYLDFSRELKKVWNMKVMSAL